LKIYSLKLLIFLTKPVEKILSDLDEKLLFLIVEINFLSRD